MKANYPAVRGNNGFSVSVQASALHYCTPQNDVGPYTHVEMGLPSGKVPRIFWKYSDGSVYHRVPVEMVERWLKKNGAELPLGMPVKRGARRRSILDRILGME